VTRRGRKCQVVDTNVAVVANRRGNESYSCVNNCAQALLNVKNCGVLVVDAGDLILSEYRATCSLSGQPGVGDSFIRWVHDNIGRADLVQMVRITPVGSQLGFEEFPGHPGLATFDPSDRKFVAVAIAHRERPSILQALDSKWWGWKEPLLECGITVDFLCAEEVQASYRRKMGQ